MFRTVELPTPAVLVPARELHTKLARTGRDHPGLPSGLDQVLRDLAVRQEGVPVTVAEPRRPGGDRSLRLHTYGYVVTLFPTRNGDGYLVVGIDPLRMRDHDRLADGHLLVRTRWRAVFELPQIPPGSSAHWPRLTGEWDALVRARGDRRQAPDISPAHERFLDTLDELIETTRRFAARDDDSPARYPYRSAEPVGERRFSGAPVYVFRIAGDRMPERGRLVRLRGEPEQRGEVVRVQDDLVTVRFDQPLDWNRLAPQGELQDRPNEVVYAKQREAVALLRSRKAHNRNLMSVFVDHDARPLTAVSAEPAEALDADQLAAFRAALGVRDVLAVLGPPGTGKTRTISEIARARALSPDRGRTLIASFTNRAVDNVLAKLPRDVVVVRVGSEGKVDAEGRTFLLEHLATELRAEIIATTAVARQGYEGVPVAQEWAGEFGRRIAALREDLAVEARAGQALDAARRSVGGPAQQRVDDLARALGDRERAAAQRADRLRSLLERQERAQRGGPWSRRWAAWMARRRSDRADRLRADLAARGQEAAALRGRLHEAAAALDLATRDAPQVIAAAGVLDQAVSARRRRAAEAGQALDAIRAALGPVHAVPVPPDTGDPAALPAALTDVHAGLGPWLACLTARARLLDEWRTAVSGATEQLYPELVRYADVVGATCTGAASRPEIAGETFDLAIIDEAGQIGTADVLVPLVRADRAVLVGDHRQLPPIVGSDVLAWAEETGDPAVRDLVTKSALEILVERHALPPSHVVALTRQRRMPKVIADFASAAFYGGRLTTHVERVHNDPLFAGPLVFADTSQLPVRDRSETPVRRGATRGTVNHAEARLLARLAAFYHRLGADWALIVPYRAQRGLIAQLLTGDIPDLDAVDHHVGTVDAFQGGERDVVLYGFTRSNRAGEVGFLDELRRANVAFTRARRQLVLVGDMDMLCRARDRGFRDLAHLLRAHVLAHGEVRHHRELMAVLEQRREAGAELA
ncbi:DEAD/DEAH box helicase [Amycolatopsis thermoflava]|uniref:DEAD/DEAH box helicase n=1 Tax=Amycolatopsis thermoflava TaxID=84480 RepID=UPI003EBE61FB